MIWEDCMDRKELVWDKMGDRQRSEAFEFCRGYREFLSRAKTERLALDFAILEAKQKGFQPIEDYSSLKPGDKVYYVLHNKALCLAIVGKRGLEQGMRIIGSHLDSPRLDLKQKPLYEEEGLALFKTHYYGGIKKYHWAAIPLALHGVVITEDGRSVSVAIGESEGDPVFTITDLLPHLAKDQMDRKTREAIAGEGLNILIASTPCEGKDDKEQRIKRNILEILEKQYGVKEEDFISAELEVVPAGPAREVGLDKGLVGGYGQDDRVCVYTSLFALLEMEDPEYTCVTIFADKEETGSDGATGMKSLLLEDFAAELGHLLQGAGESLYLRRALRISKALSADVTAAFDPNYPEVSDKHNTPFLGRGVVISKYSGVGGKYDANDTNAEFVGFVRRVFNRAGIAWQAGELGKVDQGGGGTIAQYMARYGMDVLDCGPGLLSMHSPFEIASVADIYMSFLAYRAFFTT